MGHPRNQGVVMLGMLGNGAGIAFPVFQDKQGKATQIVVEEAQPLALGTEKGRESFVRAKQVRCSA